MTEVWMPKTVNTTPVSQRSESSARSKAKYPERQAARSTVKNALRSGALVRPDSCARCGVLCKPEASHDDYSRPLDIEWLCKTCHGAKDRPTHCIRGHEFTPENTSHSNGKRNCKTCARDRRKARYAESGS